MNKLFLLLFLLFWMLSSVGKADAAIIYKEDFENGLDNWASLNGLWYINEDGQYGTLINTQSTIHTSISNVLIPVSDYILELDLIPKQGVDRNIRLRWKNNAATFEFHFNDDNGGTIHFGVKKVLYPIEYNVLQRIKVIFEGQNVKFFINDQMYFDETYPFYVFDGSEQFGLVVGTGAAAPSEVYFDNIVIKTLDHTDGIDLSVPVLKQTDSAWGNKVYDLANLWSPSSPNISSWGCALTSAAMIFKYHGINKLPNNTNLDPGSLNAWLNSQQDGYIRNGLVNWLALSRLSKTAKTANPLFNYGALEYKRVGGYASEQLSSDLENDIPGILEVPGHFVVAKGKFGDEFLINDPYYDRDNLSFYGGEFSSLGRYVPSNTDLSYIMAVVDSEVSMSVSNYINQVGETYIQYPIDNDENLGQQSGNVLNMFYLESPDGGNYKMNLSSSTIKYYNLDVYFYDIDGNVKIQKINGIVGPGDVDTYLLSFDKSDLSKAFSKEEMSFDAFINNINLLSKIGGIDRAYYKTLLNEAQNAKKLSNQKVAKNSATTLLGAMQKALKARVGKQITKNSYEILNANIVLLIAQLKK